MNLHAELFHLLNSIPPEMIPKVVWAPVAFSGMGILGWIVKIAGIAVLTDKKDAQTRLEMFSIVFTRQKSGREAKRKKVVVPPLLKANQEER